MTDKELQEPRRRRGRPRGSNHTRRDWLLFTLVSNFMHWGFSRTLAVKVACSLIADDRAEFGNLLFKRKTIIGPIVDDLKFTIEGGFSIPKDNAVFSRFNGWLREWTASGLPYPHHYSQKVVTHAYDRNASRLSLNFSVVCRNLRDDGEECGHENWHRPARGEYFMTGDDCRSCGQPTWVIL